MVVETAKTNTKTERRNKYSSAFEYFKQGKTPLEVVMDGILDPDEAQRLYEKFLRLSKLEAPKLERVKTPNEKINLTIEEWRECFKAFNGEKHPIDVIIEKSIDPGKVEYAYMKFLELSEKYISLTDHEWSLAFYFFEKDYTPLELSSRGVLNPKKAEYAYRRYTELKKPKTMQEIPVTKESLLEREMLDRLVVLFFIVLILADIEYITAAIALMRTGTFGNLNLLLLGLTAILGPRVGILTSMILTVLVLGTIMFLSAFYVREKYRDYPLLVAALLEMSFIISHATHL